MLAFSRISSSLGIFTLAIDNQGLCALHLPSTGPRLLVEPTEEIDLQAHPLLAEAGRQLQAYLAGELHVFDLPLSLTGTPFQQQVWRELLSIPYGETRTYGELAKRLGNRGKARAVGGAAHANPIAIVVPCHRLLGAGGKLTGFGGGLPMKQALLDLEKNSLPRRK
nr:methylated-DNA--[protein]-cysteine S-methyltransferase [uncultured Desulfobulbus sp.]